uniref:Uncharacterized protein n=1 Tax=Globodera pallida TaxID=36090 RepID=A0A183CN19_GLOPA
MRRCLWPKPTICSHVNIAADSFAVSDVRSAW